MREAWNERLRCLVCGKTGMASLAQDDGSETPAVQSVADGFKVVGTKFGPAFHCESCGVEVAP
jgi:hypothetical protein